MKLVSILVAEDDPADRFLIEESLGKSFLANTLHFVKDGVEAMAFLRNEGMYADKVKYPKPGLFLLDLNMPKKDGREVLEEVREDPTLCTIPIVVLTTSKEDEDLCRSYKLGANSYITKPVDFEGFVKLMSVLDMYWFGIVKLPDQ